MAQSATASASIQGAQVDNRQARLDAAIALFRAEASASGYVVEEVRLRLPVPEVDVMPRVIISQQSGPETTPPTLPRPKHPRHLSSYPSAASPDHPAASVCEQPHSNSTQSKSFGGHALETNAGFKRTISGSVIFHPVPTRVASSKHEFKNFGAYTSHAPQNMEPLSSIPYSTAKDPSSSMRAKTPQQEPKHAAFWKTVIGSERGKAILRAAESMHRMRHGADGPKFRPRILEQETAEVEVEPPTKVGVQNNGATQQEGDAWEMGEARQAGEEQAENTLYINGHNIPESHVQLLLSSAADVSAREKTTASKQVATSPGEMSSKTGNRKITTRPRVIVNGKPRGENVTPVSHGKQFSSKGRRDSSDTRHSRPRAARPFRCHKCPSSFDRDGHLRVHILAVHEKKRPFVCQVCDASFGHSSSLLRHVRTVHQASPAVGSGRHNVPTRSGQKSNDSGMTESEDLYETLEDDNEKHFRCSACGQAFHRVALLNRHVANRHPLRSSSAGKSGDTRKSP